MNIGWRAAGAVAAIAAVGATSPAQAQTPEDIARLDRMALARASAMPAVQRRQPPVMNVAQDRLQPTGGIWYCAGAEPGRPIYTEPSANARQMAVTQDHIAISGLEQNGFRMVLTYDGHIGYLPRTWLRVYTSTGKPGVQCTVVGLRQANNAPVFGYY